MREPAYQLVYQVCPDARRDSLQLEVLRLQRESVHLRDVFNTRTNGELVHKVTSLQLLELTV